VTPSRQRVPGRAEPEPATGANLPRLHDQLAGKEAAVDTYLTDYEDNKIDRDTVTRRIEKISKQVRAICHRRDELIFLADAGVEQSTVIT
jgi:hypothetical protein